MGKKIRHVAYYFWKNKFILFSIFFIMVIGFIDSSSLINRWEIQQENARLYAEIKNYEAQCHRDSLKLQQLMESPYAVIKVAREVHLMKADDEDVYLVSVEPADDEEEDMDIED